MMKQKLILLVNLGSPEQLSVGAIRKFLRSFLSDKRVVGLSRLLWYPILYGIILPLRSQKLLHKYEQIWLKEDRAPLIHYTKEQAKLLQEHLQMLGDTTRVGYAFCYGSENISAQLAKYSAEQKISELVVIPLYPQYSSSTTAAVFDQVSRYFQKSYFIPKIKFINSFAGHPLYIQALASKVREHWTNNGRADKLVVSFHSIPVKLVENGDNYIEECHLTYQLLCQELGLNPDVEAKLCFQSKFGRAKWVEPATDATLGILARAEVATVDVICPGFVSDCLETLEEVAIQYRELFVSCGGRELRYIPCLNSSSELAIVLNKIIQES